MASSFKNDADSNFETSVMYLHSYPIAILLSSPQRTCNAEQTCMSSLLHAVSKTAQPAKLIPILSMHFLGQGTLLHKRDQTHSPLYKTHNVKSEKQNLEPGFSGLGSDLFFRQHLKKIVSICSRDPP